MIRTLRGRPFVKHLLMLFDILIIDLIQRNHIVFSLLSFCYGEVFHYRKLTI